MQDILDAVVLETRPYEFGSMTVKIGKIKRQSHNTSKNKATHGYTRPQKIGHIRPYQAIYDNTRPHAQCLELQLKDSFLKVQKDSKDTHIK